MTPKPGPKKERPKNRAQKMVTIFSQRGEARQSGFTPVPKKWCPENGPQKMVVFLKKTGPKNGPQTSAACNKNCQLTNRQLTPREKPSDASQMKNHSLMRRSSTEYSNHQHDGSKNECEATSLTYIIVLNSTASTSQGPNVNTNNS